MRVRESKIKGRKISGLIYRQVFIHYVQKVKKTNSCLSNKDEMEVFIGLVSHSLWPKGRSERR